MIKFQKDLKEFNLKIFFIMKYFRNFTIKFYTKNFLVLFRGSDTYYFWIIWLLRKKIRENIFCCSTVPVVHMDSSHFITIRFTLIRRHFLEYNLFACGTHISFAFFEIINELLMNLKFNQIYYYLKFIKFSSKIYYLKYIISILMKYFK